MQTPILNLSVKEKFLENIFLLLHLFLTKQEVVDSMMCSVQFGRARIDSAKSNHSIF